MKLKSLTFILILAAYNTCFASNDCVEEGNAVVIYSDALKCCTGLELRPPQEGIVGSTGICVKTRQPASEKNDKRQEKSKKEK